MYGGLVHWHWGQSLKKHITKNDVILCVKSRGNKEYICYFILL